MFVRHRPYGVPEREFAKRSARDRPKENHPPDDHLDNPYLKGECGHGGEESEVQAKQTPRGMTLSILRAKISSYVDISMASTYKFKLQISHQPVRRRQRVQTDLILTEIHLVSASFFTNDYRLFGTCL